MVSQSDLSVKRYVTVSVSKSTTAVGEHEKPELNKMPECSD